MKNHDNRLGYYLHSYPHPLGKITFDIPTEVTHKVEFIVLGSIRNTINETIYYHLIRDHIKCYEELTNEENI